MARPDTRVYVVEKSNGEAAALVRARSIAAAVRHVVKGQYSARCANQNDLINHLPTLAVEDAGEDE